MADVELAGLDDGLVAAVKALMVVDVFTQLGVDPRVYTIDSIPNEPQEPYVVVELLSGGYGWDEGLSLGGECGWPDIQVTGVGRLVKSARWGCDVMRSYLRKLDPATVGVGGDTHIKLVTSMGPPTNPIEAGTLFNVVETYNMYVEAS